MLELELGFSAGTNPCKRGLAHSWIPGYGIDVMSLASAEQPQSFRFNPAFANWCRYSAVPSQCGP